MGLHAYLVRKDIGDVIFDCFDDDEWTKRLLAMGKFDNGVWMEFTGEELAEMEATGNLTPYEQEIVTQLQGVVEANGGQPAYLEYF